MFNRQCPTCGRELLYKQKCQVTEANKKNRKCASCARRTVGLNTKCDQCSKMFYRRPSDMRRLNFCSQECSSINYSNTYRGENSPAWNGGRIKSKERDKLKTREKRVLLKTKGVEYLGGKCKKCGYDKCIAALDFHHPDPTVKDDGFSKKCEKDWDTMKSKIEGCILLCSNCHREHHYNEKKLRSKI